MYYIGEHTGIIMYENCVVSKQHQNSGVYLQSLAPAQVALINACSKGLISNITA